MPSFSSNLWGRKSWEKFLGERNNLRRYKGARAILANTPIVQGHSCNNGNAPDFVEIFLKTVICGFWMNIWYGITFTKTEKVMGKLKKDFFIYIWQNVWFFCPEETLTIFCKIKCQSFNFICQALEKSLKFAYQSYRLKEYICFRIFLKMRFFWPICELVMFFKSS